MHSSRFLSSSCGRCPLIGFLTETRVPVMTFAPPTTHLFRLFDGSLFPVLKQHGRYELPSGDEEVTVKFRIKVSHGFKLITVDSNIWRIFRHSYSEFRTRE
jgi:hypothetical protein